MDAKSCASPRFVFATDFVRRRTNLGDLPRPPGKTVRRVVSRSSNYHRRAPRPDSCNRTYDSGTHTTSGANRMVRIFRALTLLACLVCAPFASAQSASGHIAGVITDEQGTPVPGVFVTAHGADQSKRIQTDSEGQYLLPNLL